MNSGHFPGPENVWVSPCEQMQQENVWKIYLLSISGWKRSATHVEDTDDLRKRAFGANACVDVQ